VSKFARIVSIVWSLGTIYGGMTVKILRRHATERAAKADGAGPAGSPSPARAPAAAPAAAPASPVPAFDFPPAARIPAYAEAAAPEAATTARPPPIPVNVVDAPGSLNVGRPITVMPVVAPLIDPSEL